MPIDSLHPMYRSYSGKWERCRDAFEGSDAIKAKGPKYLPRLSKQKAAEYNAYKDRALFYSITSKTVGALLGMAMVRPPVIRMPEGMKSYYEVDKGVQFLENLSKILSEDLLMGRIGVLVDRPAINALPKLIPYCTESIINWKVDAEDNPILIVFKECEYLPTKDDMYELGESIGYLELILLNGVYTCRKYNEKKDLISTVIPTNKGKPMDHIPFYIANPIGLGFELSKPPVIDIVDINISHYRSSADLEHGRHFTALPTPYATGVAGASVLEIGSTTAWILPDANSKVGFLEFTGQGLQSLEKALSEKQGQLASLSARLLDNSQRGSESPDTIRLRYSSESASLSSVVRACEALMIKCYREVAIMEEFDPEEVNITLNKEFMDSKLTPAQIIDFITSYLDGGISAETLVYNLRRGDIIPISIDDKQAIAEVEANKKETLAREAKKLAPVKPAASSTN